MEIITENYNCESGDRVSGTLKLSTTETFQPTHVEIRFIGVAQVKLIELALPFKETVHTSELLHLVSNLEIDEINHSDVQEIPFEFNLPEDIPSSFNGPDGSINYNVEAKVTTADGQEHKHYRKIKVHSPIKNGLKTSIGNSVEKDFGLMSLGSGRKKGFYAGETIQLQCDVFNESTVECTPRATLYQTQVYMCGERHKASQVALAEPVVGQKVDKHSNNSQTLAIPIPREAYLTIKSDIISIKYFIHVTLDIPFAFDIHLNLPIVVTTQSALNAHR